MGEVSGAPVVKDDRGEFICLDSTRVYNYVMKTAHPTFQTTLRRLREAKDISPEELAVMSGVHAQTIRKLEDGQRTWPRLDIAKKLAVALGVSLDELAG